MTGNKIKLITFISLLLFIFSLLACTDKESNNDSTRLDVKENITLLITKNNGGEILSSRVIKFEENKNVLDILSEHHDVETKYGGGFVNGIDGIISRTNSLDGNGEDWFYFVNGEEFNVSSIDYIVKKGDKIQWDFREWDMESLNKKSD